TGPRSISGRNRSRDRSYGEPVGESPTALGGGASADRLNAGARKGSLAAGRVALEIVLLVGRLLPESTGLADPGDGLAEPVARGVDVANRLLGHPALLVARAEDLRAVDRADEPLIEVGPMGEEEVLEKGPVGDPLGVEDDLHGLGVAPGALLRRVFAFA